MPCITICQTPCCSRFLGPNRTIQTILHQLRLLQRPQCLGLRHCHFPHCICKSCIYVAAEAVLNCLSMFLHWPAFNTPYRVTRGERRLPSIDLCKRWSISQQESRSRSTSMMVIPNAYTSLAYVLDSLFINSGACHRRLPAPFKDVLVSVPASLANPKSQRRARISSDMRTFAPLRSPWMTPLL